MCDLGYYLRHPPATSTGAASLLDAQRPLGAGRFQFLFGSNALHLLRENSLRTLAAHPGTVNGLWRTSLGGVAAPTPADVQWGRVPGDGVLLVDFGVHHVERYGERASWPVVRCDFRWAPEDAGDTIGAVLVVIPAPTGPGATAPIVLPSSPDFYAADTYTGSTSFADQTLRVPLSDALVAPLHTSPASGYPAAEPDEQGRRNAFRAFLGTFNTSDQNAPGRRASVLGLSLFLEAP